MKTLSPDGFQQARSFIKTTARPLEKALYAYHFESADPETAVAELLKYQNADGGFGKGLEPDLQNPDSSVLATAMGLRCLKDLGVEGGEPPVEAAVQYFLDTYDSETSTWRIVPPSSNDYPHAPWWHDDGGSLASTFDNFLVNPRAEVIALCYHYSAFVPPGWLTDLTEKTVASIERLEKLGSGGGDDLVSCLALVEEPLLPDEFRQRLLMVVLPAVRDSVSRDREAWTGYSIEPLKLSPRPGSVAAEILVDILPANLDFKVDSQSPQGSWDPTWSWFGNYPDEWENAKRDWQGILTLNTLLNLQSYGRIE